MLIIFNDQAGFEVYVACFLSQPTELNTGMETSRYNQSYITVVTIIKETDNL